MRNLKVSFTEKHLLKIFWPPPQYKKTFNLGFLRGRGRIVPWRAWVAARPPRHEEAEA